MDLRHPSWHCNEEQNTIGPSPSWLVVQMGVPYVAVVGEHLVLHVAQASFWLFASEAVAFPFGAIAPQVDCVTKMI